MNNCSKLERLKNDLTIAMDVVSSMALATCPPLLIAHLQNKHVNGWTIACGALLGIATILGIVYTCIVNKTKRI